MTKKSRYYSPKISEDIVKMGRKTFKLARNSTNLTTIQLLKRAGITVPPLYHIEKGNPSVALWAYYNVLPGTRYSDDFLKLAADE
jgi:transcriptional regulator with XRE-family HTH domain